MSHAVDSKSAQAHLIDPLNAPEPAAETGLNSHFGSTFAPATNINSSSSQAPASKHNYSHSASSGLKSNPYRRESPKQSPPSKNGVSTTVRSSSGSPREPFPNYRSEAFAGAEPGPRRRADSHGTPPSYHDATSSTNLTGRPRRGSSLKERYPGDKSGQPLDMIRRDSKKAYRSPHLNKRSMPGADSIDKLDPAIGGRAYHHEGPYDAALMSRNRDPKRAPVAALETSNREALKATPQENIKDAVERHKPLDGVASIPPGQPDRFGRTYDYREGTDMMHVAGGGDAGYKRWPEKDYDPEDLKGQSEPAFSLDRALKAHTINENGIEMSDRSNASNRYHDAERQGQLDPRDPVDIAGGESKYADMEIAAESGMSGANTKHSGLESLKKRIGSLKHRKDE